MSSEGKRLFIVTVILIFASLSLFIYINYPGTPSSKRTSFMLNTTVSVQAFGENAEKAVNESMNRLQEIENLMSTTLENSDIYRINKNTGQEVKVHPDTLEVIKRSITFARDTDGKLDPGIGPLVELWGFRSDNPGVPDKNKIQNTKKLVDYKEIEIDQTNNTVKIKPGMSLDLGATAKGYAAEEVKKIITEHGIESAFIDLGGHIQAIGKKIDGQLWNVGIQDPRIGYNTPIGSLKINDRNVVTSGEYERYFKENNSYYHHIIDPSTGKPADKGLKSVTIITDDSFKADALSTGLFVMKLEKGLDFIENIDNTEAIFITDERKVYLSSGIKNDFIIRGPDYILAN